MKKSCLILFLLALIFTSAGAQKVVRTVDLFQTNSGASQAGNLRINQNPGIDTLISRHIEANRINGGVEGFRIQIFRKGGQTAREEADKAMAKVLSEFPDIKAYLSFQAPNFYLVRLGDFRTKIEATKAHAEIRRVFRDSYIIREKINFPEIIN
jgi:hypothetical protein